MKHPCAGGGWGRALALLLCLALALSGCVSSGAEPAANKRTRPNDPVLRIPEAPETKLIGKAPLQVDVSNCAQGYVMAKYTGKAAKANLQLTGPDGVTYKYFLTPSKDYEALPLSGGNGVYRVDAYENIQGNQYAVLYKETLNVKLADELLPALYANRYVDFLPESQVVAKAKEVVASATSDLNAVEKIYHFVIQNVKYDTKKAETVGSGYLPVVDETLRTGKGICFDYAALTAAMLRSQNIPTKLEVGYAGEIYHAWISVYTKESGWIDKIIEFRSNGWTRMDPTFASSNGNNKKILKYIGDGSNYVTMYSY